MDRKAFLKGVSELPVAALDLLYSNIRFEEIEEHLFATICPHTREILRHIKEWAEGDYIEVAPHILPSTLQRPLGRYYRQWGALWIIVPYPKPKSADGKS